MKVIILSCLLTAVLGYSYNDTMIEEDFHAVDTNADGHLTVDELLSRFKRDDENGDSRITFLEFNEGLRPGTSRAVNMAAFTLYDKLDGRKDNVINLSDLKLVFLLLDHDKNNNVTLEEYKKAVQLMIQVSMHEAGSTA